MKQFDMNLQLFAAEDGVITAANMKKVREVDFVEQFAGTSLKKLMEALGVTRKIPMMEGTTMYAYTTVGYLEDGMVDEGDVIPLSQYVRRKEPVGEIGLKKWRKAVTAEAIKKSGYDEAMRETDARMLNDIQKGIRADFFNFLTAIGSEPVQGETLQAVLAKLWGSLQVLFEDDAVDPVFFINPLTVAEYMATASVTVQTAFGLNYITDFLGLGTVVMSSYVPQGTVYATAKDNLILYYLTLDGDVARAFDLTVDETGFVGMHTAQTDDRAQIETLVMSGVQFLVEYIDGVVTGEIAGASGGGSDNDGGLI